MKRLLKIDELVADDHSYVDEDDECYYFVEYTARKGYNHSEGNNLISNLKKSLHYKGKPAWKYKEQAIAQAAQMINEHVLKGADLKRITLVPIPPSKNKEHAEYDDRILRIIQQASANLRDADIRELLLCTDSIDAAHESDVRPSIQELEDNLEIDEDLIEDVREYIYLFDDVITTGAHFIACRNVLLNEFPEAIVVGIFVARRAIEHDASDFDFGFDDEDLELDF